MREILRQLCFLGTLLGREAVGRRGDTQTELGKAAKELSKEEPSRRRELMKGGRGKLPVLAPKEVHVAQVMLSRMVAASHTGFVEMEMRSKCKIYANLEDSV